MIARMIPAIVGVELLKLIRLWGSIIVSRFRAKFIPALQLCIVSQRKFKPIYFECYEWREHNYRQCSVIGEETRFFDKSEL